MAFVIIVIIITIAYYIVLKFIDIPLRYKTNYISLLI